MGSRDHSAQCDVCGEDRGGMNDDQCRCDQVAEAWLVDHDNGDTEVFAFESEARAIAERDTEGDENLPVTPLVRIDMLLTAEACLATCRALLGEARRFIANDGLGMETICDLLREDIDAALKEGP